jgi:uncharacterized protein (TIGR00730 family)
MNAKHKNRPHKIESKETLNLEKINETMNNRLDAIENEFTNGFEFIKKNSKSVTIFGSARTLPDEKDYIKARELGQKIAKELDYAVITGGGPGIMEAGNRGAHEVGGKSMGMTIKLPMEQVTNPYLTDHIDFKYFFARKVCMSFSAEAYVYFPGGFGTLDELFEILTLVQTNKIDPTPIILVGKKYWNGVDKMIKKFLLKAEKIDPQDIDLYTITDDLDEVIDIIRKAPVRIGIE